ncbi:hypothetical protein WN55_06217 [Dufourea novaeangliae]|uniref:Uncharacterized protein n=1 Tax=Dufourea novaeangliae TaxID=178035 RepID=A0A154PQ35_DUFNO|nr:hypothetical protein WN55_06217 [Dufourea novaeangliae]
MARSDACRQSSDKENEIATSSIKLRELKAPKLHSLQLDRLYKQFLKENNSSCKSKVAPNLNAARKNQSPTPLAEVSGNVSNAANSEGISEQWENPKKSNKVANIKGDSSSDIPSTSNNPYSILSNAEEMDLEDNAVESENTENNLRKVSKPPPIYTEDNVQHYTFTPKNMKPKSLIIKGIKGNFSVEEIKNEIEEFNLPNLRIIKLSKFNYNKADPDRFHYIIQVSAESKTAELKRLPHDHQFLKQLSVLKASNVFGTINRESACQDLVAVAQRLGHFDTTELQKEWNFLYVKTSKLARDNWAKIAFDDM